MGTLTTARDSIRANSGQSMKTDRQLRYLEQEVDYHSQSMYNEKRDQKYNVGFLKII